MNISWSEKPENHEKEINRLTPVSTNHIILNEFIMNIHVPTTNIRRLLR